MNILNKGFVPIIILITIFLVAGLGGYVYFQSQGTPTINTVTIPDSSTITIISTSPTTTNQLSVSTTNPQENQFKENPKIGDIIINPELYEGKEVIIDGKYGGWRGHLENCDLRKTGMMTRSDQLIYDETGCLYMLAGGGVEVLYNEKPLDPWDGNNYGANLKIKGIISLMDGKPYIAK